VRPLRHALQEEELIARSDVRATALGLNGTCILLAESFVGSSVPDHAWLIGLPVPLNVTPYVIVGGVPLVHDCGAHFALLEMFSCFHLLPMSAALWSSIQLECQYCGQPADSLRVDRSNRVKFIDL